MVDLLLLSARNEEVARSPELGYLASSRLAAARRVFGRVDEIFWGPEGEGELEDRVLGAGRPLLVLGAQQVHLGAASVKRMKAALDAGASVVLPDTLESFDLAGEEPIHTLRDFEDLESRILAGALTPSRHRCSHLPVALLSPAFLAGHRDRLSVAAVLNDPALLEGLEATDSRVPAGVYYPFIDYYGEVREDILPFLPDGVDDVLDIGCGRGRTGRILQQRLGCRVTGIEINPEIAADAARHLHRVIVGNAEELAEEMAAGDERFDAIVATELFEHLNYPESFLARMKPLLRPGGRIILSVPNVGHYSIVEDLLAGRWDYVPMGLLCYTHFRFFTRATLESWVERAGFERYEIVVQKGELPERFSELGGFEVDRENLATTGFYVLLEG